MDPDVSEPGAVDASPIAAPEASSVTGGSDPLARRLVAGGAFSLLAWILLQWVSPPEVVVWTPTMREASETMARALETASAHCAARGVRVDPTLDPAESCLVGPQLTPLFTTLGQLEAKRTTLNPDMAALLVHLLREAGVGAGDTVAVGASGSFPGLLVATLAAVEALDAIPVPILSLGASSYGATRPEFHLLDLHLLLNREGVLQTVPAAVSLGGEGDDGRSFPDELRASLIGQIRNRGILFLDGDSLPTNVARRMRLYGRPRAFVNAGGAQANLGTDPAILEVPPGLTRDLGSELLPPPHERRGVLFEMAARDVPVIHLLHIRGLAIKHGLPWDPRILPEVGTTRIRSGLPSRGWAFWLLTTLFLLGLTLLFLLPLFSEGTVRRRPTSRSLTRLS